MKVPLPPKSHKQKPNTSLFKIIPRPYHKTSTTQYKHKPTHINNLLNTSTQTKNLKHATQIHTQIITNNYISFPFLFNNLLNLYAKCGHINQTLLLFSTTQNHSKNIVTWTSLITRLSHFNKHLEALKIFNQMRCSGVYPNQFTFSAILPTCADSMVVVHGELMHCLIGKHGFDTDVFVGSALIDMYAKCGDMCSAMQVFDEMPDRNLVSWNSMIVGFLQNKFYDMAVGYFRDVLREVSIRPDQVSFSSVLSACADTWGLEVGKQVHGVIVKHGLVTLAYVRNSLMDMYFKCGMFDDAAILFQITRGRDVVAWNVMIMGCINNNYLEEACNYFWVMMREGISPDESSYSTALHASACLAALNQGTLIHNQIIRNGFLNYPVVASSLITMYTKSGSLGDAYRVFELIEYRNVVSWTAMIGAFQQHGCANQVIELFEKMLGEGIKPDYITFVSVISACSHGGRVEEGYAYFNSMEKLHGLRPGHEHYACMVDLLGRAGRLDEAKKFIEAMPIEADSSVWGALLGACTNYGNIEMGQGVAERLFELEPDNPGNYVLLSNLYARYGKLKEANEVRNLMGVNSVRKEPGCSWIDVKNETFVFTVHDRSHSRTYEIYEMLREIEGLVKRKGYVAETQFAVNSADECKERSLWYHSEKLALAYGLLSLPSRAPIRIKKNLRTCGDCHTVMKFASEIFEREIIVRDIKRFHRFSNGICSCGDYW
ncbi:PPR domain-containing protein/PPR_2 domain-containing protein/DYW_deaminase domain-containing protein [Cephalotus follicularis]|uniref:PPR domain-containing protein/PPR_2 domain-containing protein/DYW_deaminase domain-containing protein n=1 Tax=Cephalotus follicularis TaxID=3775 RepID=A0A1Q3C346_CEPFO|nr:PPR domain-containing protein/PPR_2 domain-containing protein/DYW_deaminase domain-containing protein [Cephalotus follicularis]